MNAVLSRRNLCSAGSNWSDRMPAPRKIFRIEEMARLGLCAVEAAPAPRGEADTMQARILEELGALHALMAAPVVRAAPAPAGDTAKVAAQLMRSAHELDAVTSGTAQATQKILAAAEDIDQVANTLSASLKGRIEQDLAADIRDLVVVIFEACNFQDLIGQRVAKVKAALERIGEHAGRAPGPATGNGGADLLHGPRLAGDRGHVTQHEIDAMFGG